MAKKLTKPKDEENVPEQGPGAAAGAAKVAGGRKRAASPSPAAAVPARKPRKRKDEETEPEDGPGAEEAAKVATGRKLVIVESPAKARTINKYLGAGYVVRASQGHVRDLPKGRFGIDVDHGFEPAYTTITGRTKVIGELKRLAKVAQSVYLASDPDREGEAIAWHLFESLDVPAANVHRVIFNEITKKAILEAFEHPGKLDMNKVDAQQARRVLDRIMGYKLSPLLWRKIAKGLSAGRVQSVAVRLIVDREKEIRAFIKEEYWRVTAHLVVDGAEFDAELKRLGERRIDKNLGEEEARALVKRIGGSPLTLLELDEKPKTRPPTPPFTTSQLQQKASTMLRFSAKKTMMVAQQLYEGVEIPIEGSVGLITYMRTDSTRVSDDALRQVREVIDSQFGKAYLPDAPNHFRTKAKGAQEAHEAVRPTDASRTPQQLKNALTPDQLKLYTLIWNKFVASQMKPGLSSVTTAIFAHGDARFVAQGEVEVFDGHTRLFAMATEKDEPDTPAKMKQGAAAAQAEREEQMLPKSLKKGESYTPRAIDPTQHFTQPPPRFSEATLVKELEKKGIGRPSTYATIISTVQERGYVTLEARKFKATELGEIVTDQLVEHFKDILDTDFTAGMEEGLDQVESGEREWRKVVRSFYDPFMTDLVKAERDMTDMKRSPVLTERKCEKCGAPMAELYNKRGKFLGCSNYPTCKNTMSMDGPREVSEATPTDYKCPKCEKPMVIRNGKRGKFLACTGFPKCKSTASVDEQGKIVVPKVTGVLCDKCSMPMVIKGSKRGPFLACTGYPKCRNAKPLPDELREKPKETGEKCEKCGKPMVERTSRWGKPFLSCSGYPECKNARNLAPAADGEGEPQVVEATTDTGQRDE